MTMLTGRLKKRIEDCKLPDKVLLQAIDFAETGGLNTPVATPSPQFVPESEVRDVLADAISDEPKPKRRRGYNRRDMRAE